MGGMLLRAVAAALLIVTWAKAAAAQDVPSAREVILGTPERARRAVAFGPTIGIAAAVAPDGEDIDVPLGGGLGFALFDVPVVPTPEMVLSIAKERARARLVELARGGARPDAEQVLQEMRDEVLRELSPRPRVREKPRLFGVAEATYGPVEEAWELRAHLALGVLGLTIGPTVAGHIGAIDGMMLGGELGFLLVPSPRPRASVVNLYLRGEAGVSGDAATTFALGVRYLVDLL